MPVHLGDVAIDRIGLGLAVTLEFLGPLSVALLASRHTTDIGCALIAGAAAVILARPQPSTDYASIILALLAAFSRAGMRQVPLGWQAGHRRRDPWAPVLHA